MLAVINRGKYSPTHLLLTIYVYSNVTDHVINEQAEVIIQSESLTKRIIVTVFNISKYQ